ncbi:MAG: DUF4097 domain-containing protein [Verrucomicrobiota bacterium]|nr:DUF4097 domain-containing protein [Verrucomicrobiota bacterium]
MIKIANFIAASLFFASGVIAAPLVKETEETYAVPADAVLKIHNVDGRIFLYGSEKDEVKIVARKKAYSQARLAAISVKVAIDGNRVGIDVIYPPRPQGFSLQDRSGTTDLIMVVPQTCSIAQAELVNGEIIIEGIRGTEVNARLTNGVLAVTNCFSALRLNATQGTVDVSFGWWEAHDVSLQAELSQGNVRLALPADPAVRLEVTSVSGQITNRFGEELGESDGRTLKTVIGDEGGAEFKIHTSSANVKIEHNY